MAVVSAGSFVASVLEHAGFMTQARFLESFKEFFQYGGGLLYLITGVGAILSVAMFGSYRAARYLLIGPAIFWFLVGPTVDTEGVLWRLGGGQFRGQGTKTGQDEAVAFRNKVLTEAGAGQNAGPTKVAAGFWMWAWPINEFVREFVNVILKDEDTTDKLAMSKTRGLEIMFHELPRRPDFATRFEEGLMTRCAPMFNAAVGAAPGYIREQAAKGAGAPAGSQDALKTYYLERLKRAADKTDLIDTGETQFKEWIEVNGGANGGTVNALSKASQFVDENKNARQSITCAEAWDLIAEELYFGALGEVNRLIKKTAEDGDTEALIGQACRLLEVKLFGANSRGGESSAKQCSESVAAGIAISTIANTIKRDDVYSRLFKRHWNNRDLINPKKTSVIVGANAPAGYSLSLDDKKRPITTMTMSAANVPSMLVQYERVNPKDNTKVDRFWAPMASIDSIDGVDHAMWISMARFQTNLLRQKIFTWAMQVPYFQGVLLFLLAASYPFFAMIVILPGRAHNFINLPLAYLWVKSWDIGFAAIIILDKVLYNMLPSVDLPVALQKGPWYGLENFALVVAEALKLDPTFGPHLYYANLSMVMLAIPALTGAIIMKGRQGALATFTDGLAQQANDAANRLGGAYGAVAGDDRHRMGMQIQGLAKRSVTLGSDSLGTGTLSGADANFWGKVAGGANLFQKGSLTMPFKSGMEAQIEAEQTRNAMLRTGNEYDAALRASFDPMLGRWGMLPMLKGAYYAAMDPSGFEVEDRSVIPNGELTKLFLQKFTVATDSTQGVIGTMLASPATKNGMGVLDVMIMGSIMTAAPDRLGDPNQSKMDQLKQMIGAQAYSDKEVISRLFHMDSEDATSGPQGGNLLGVRSETGRKMFSAMFGDEKADPGLVPGGASSVLERHLDSTGGARQVLRGGAPVDEADTFTKTVQGAAEMNRKIAGVVTPLMPTGDFEKQLDGTSRFVNQLFNPFGEDGAIKDTFAPPIPPAQLDVLKAFDDKLEEKKPELYGAMRDRVVHDLAIYYGYEGVHDMGDIADRLKADYANARAKAINVPQGEPFHELQFGELPQEYLKLADEQPLLAGQLIEQWNFKRMQQSAEKFGYGGEEREDYVSGPDDLFRTD